MGTLLGTDHTTDHIYIYLCKGTFEDDDFPFPVVGYVIVSWRVLDSDCAKETSRGAFWEGFWGGIGVAQQENMLSESGSSGSVGVSPQ